MIFVYFHFHIIKTVNILKILNILTFAFLLIRNRTIQIFFLNKYLFIANSFNDKRVENVIKEGNGVYKYYRNYIKKDKVVKEQI